MFSDTYISTWVDRLRAEIPDAAAIILKGSAARGEASRFSDLDFDVLVHPGPVEDYRVWIDEQDERMAHISVAVHDVAAWCADAEEPVSWAYGLPAQETTTLLWAKDDDLRERLDRPWRSHPPEEPELEDFIEAWGKVRNALRRENDLAMRLAGQKLARLCPGLLRPLNPEVCPSNRREAMMAVLAFPVAPDGYREDLLTCFGMSAEASSIQDVHNASARLVFGTLPLLREHADVMAELLPDDLSTMLADGTLERYATYLMEVNEDG